MNAILKRIKSDTSILTMGMDSLSELNHYDAICLEYAELVQAGLITHSEAVSNVRSKA